MISSKNTDDCFESLSCGEEEYHVCKRRGQCLTAAENLERMKGNIGEGEIPFSLFVEYRKERWGLSCMALKEMWAAHA